VERPAPRPGGPGGWLRPHRGADPARLPARHLVVGAPAVRQCPAYAALRDDLTARGLEYVSAPHPTGVSLAGPDGAIRVRRRRDAPGIGRARPVPRPRAASADRWLAGAPGPRPDEVGGALWAPL